MGKRKRSLSSIESTDRNKKENWNLQTSQTKENKQYEEYYKLQGVVCEEEMKGFMTTMKMDLPITFRINENYAYKKQVIQELQTRFHYEGSISFEGYNIPCIHPLLWYNDNMIWELDIQRKKLRKIPQFADLHTYLIELNNNGIIEREELVSMLPPLFLAPSKEDCILDMCASPGSKTLHLLEMIHQGDGCIVANEANMNRIGMLINHVSCCHSTKIAVTHCLAQDFPPTPLSSSFDKVLCDVPCSGDGTLRKNPELWTSWNLKYSFLLHPLQVSILMRGLECVKVGGRVVYSTCSLNPIEDEAVISAVLSLTGNTVHLKDMSHLYPQLQRRPGLLSWKIITDDHIQYTNWDDVPQDKSYIVQSCFPPSLDQSKHFHLERCMRFLPHLNNSGGFFIAVLEKIGESRPSPPPSLSGSLKTEQEIMKKKTKKERLIPLQDTSITQQLSSFFGIDKGFDWKNVFAKNANNHDLYIVHPTLQPLLHSPEEVISFISTGMKVFEFNNSESSCPYKLSQDGLKYVVPFMTKRVFNVNKETFLKVLQNGGLIESYPPSFQNELKAVPEGCIVMAYTQSQQPLYYSVWKSKQSLNVLVKKTEIQYMMRLIDYS